MKKILSLLALLMLCIVGANAETVKYALTEGDTFTSGQTVEVKNGDAVVATLTYGESAGTNDFKSAKSYTGIEGYTAFTEGNGTNGNQEGGTFYTITPKVDATISVAVCLNANKAFYIEEDGTALSDYNGIKVDAKYYGTYEFEATANKAYKVYCAGSKLGFFGFEMTYSSEASPNETYTIGAKLAGFVNMDLTLAENTALPYTTTFADCYRSAAGSEPASYIQLQNAAITSGTNVTLGELNGWDTTFTISEEGTSEISLTLNMGAMTITVNVTKYIPVEMKTFSLVPGPWDVDGARFAAWTWSNEEDGQWIDFAKVGETYTIDIPATNTGLILARMNGETTENNWNEGTLWNKTGDINITDVPNNYVFTITGWGENDYTISAPAAPIDIDAVKTALTEAIQKAKELNAYANDADLATAIADAETAVAGDDAAAIVDAAKALEAAAIKAAKDVLAKAVELANTFGINTTTAQDVLDKEDATVEDLATALTTLVSTAKPAAQTMLATALTFFNTFDGNAAEALKDDFAAAAAALEGTDISAMISAAQTLIANATPAAKTAMEKVMEYFEVIQDEPIKTDVAALKAAMENNNLQGIFAAVEQLKTDFPKAADDFIKRVEFSTAGYKDAGKTNGIDQVEAAIANAKQALNAEDATIVTIGMAIRNLILTLQTYVEANNIYTIAGTKDLTGTEEDWQVVEANNMTLVDGLYTWTAENITVNAENQPQFKVVITNIDGNQTWIPASEEGNDHNWIITPEVVGGEGVYNITITYNAKTKNIGVTGVKAVAEGIIPDGTYYVMNANEGTLINAEGALDAKGSLITFTFDKVNNAYTIEGADFFSGKQWTIANAIEGLSGYYTISTAEGFLAASATNTLEQIADGTADAAVWILLEKVYWEDIVNSTYTVAGTKNLTGTENDWDIDEANQMTYNDETQLYEKKFKRIAIDAENQPEFKVVQTNMAGENIWYPENNWVITTDYVGGEGLYDITITFDPSDLKEIGVSAVDVTPEPVNNTYTATFTTNAGWDEVYAYAWTGDGDAAVKFLGDWPGTKLEAAEGVYTVTIEAAEAPAFIIFNNGAGAQTADLAFEDGKAYEFTINNEWAEAIAAAEALADPEAVAVGKLIAAIEVAQGIAEPSDEEKAALQAAVDQYKLDNADQEKDETAKVATNGWKKFDGSDAGVCATQFAPAIDTYDGRKNVQLAEVYETTVETTGTIIYQDITGLTNGKYKAGFYGNAFFTSGRGFDSTMEDGATDVAYVFANDQKEFITARIATSTTENDFRTFDVEVTDGTIKLGMGKDKPGTNWHTMQIYQLTWFATAKEVFAELYREFNVKLFAAATVLDDENKTNGREDFQAAVNAAEAVKNNIKMYNISELEAELAKLTAAVTTFQQANWYIDFAAGEYYVINATTGLKMAAGHDWGTRGIVNEAGLDLTLTPYEQSRTVTIDSRVSNGGNSHFLGSNLYMDSSEWGWALEYQGFGFYILEPNSGKYINLDADNNLVLSDTPCEWIIVSKQGVREALLAEMADATKDNPVDATGLIVAQNFNRNDARNAEAWIVSEDCNNKNLSGGNNVNNCAESYHSTFTIMQTIQGAPAGFYQLTAQGFYRQDDFEGDVPAAPVFFANGVNGDVPVLAEGGPNGMSAASEAFTNGDYTIDPINFEVKEDGMMYIGITASTNTQWVIWDNFRLMYFGQDNPTTGIATVNTSVNQNGTIYNLAGQKVTKAQKGLYIVNGRKQVVR